MDTKILGWHFTDGWKLRDGSALVVGSTYEVLGPIKICESGLHASKRLLDAMEYAPGSILSRVESWGDITEHDDKYVSRCRKVIATVDAEMILHNAACDIAEVALLIGEVDDQRSWNAIEAKRAWLRKEITDEELAAARDAARAAAWAAAWDEINSALKSTVLEMMNCQ